MAIDTIPLRIQNLVRTQPESPAFYEKVNGSWRSTSWRGYVDLIQKAGRAMITLGFDPGDAVSILGFNRPEWTIFDVAAMSCGGVPAGIYTTNSAEECRHVIAHSRSRFLLIEDAHQWQKILKILPELPELKHVVTMKNCATIDHSMVLSWEQFLAKAESTPLAEFEKRVENLRADQLATLIYTSGTTGPSKGVMLSHHNLAWTADCALKITDARASDCALSYLPLSHIAEQMFTIHVASTAGYAVYYAESIEKVPDNLKEVQPTVFFGVPRIWEKFHEGVSTKMAAATGAKAHLVNWARGVGTQVSKLKMRGKEPSGLLAAQYKLANKLIFSKVKPLIGLGRARISVSGAAPIDRAVLEFMASLDVQVNEVYGQSEGAGPTSFNVPGDARFGTVGKPLPGVEVKIADDGEIVVRGPNVFLGYYREPEATAETLQNGWLHSGDLGAFDAEGFLMITGRKKEIIITAGGKNITPVNIENAIKNIPIVGEAVVIGDRRKFLSALVTLAPEKSAAFAAERGLNAATLHQNPVVLAEIQAGIDKLNENFARVEQVKKFTVLPRVFTIENLELTPTLKIKRRNIAKNWEKEIEAMYEGEG